MSHSRSTGRVLSIMFSAMLLTVLLSMPARAQETTPKEEVFIGYQWLNPGGTVPIIQGSSTTPTAFRLPSLPRGFGASLTYNVNRIWGMEVDFGGNWSELSQGSELALSAGPRLTWRQDKVNLFVHGLIGYNQLAPNGQNGRNGFGGIVGGGMDLKATRMISVRVIEADWVPTVHHFSDIVAPPAPLEHARLNGARVRAGLVFNFGGAPEIPPTAACAVQPGEVMVGEPITATVTTNNFNPKHTLSYGWTSTGGKVTAKDTTATIDTNGVAGGSYSVTARVTDPKMKKGGEASCSANFTVKEPPKNPPTMSLSASPTSVQAGTPISLTATCTSPDNVPVNVAGWTATGGSISGSGGTATLNTTGVAPGSITVSAGCTDSRGLASPTASAQVTVEKPPLPAVNKEVEARLALGHSVYFPTAQPTVQKPDEGLLPSQAATLTSLAADFTEYLKAKPDAHLILEGHADRRGSVEYNEALSQRRVDRTKNYLVDHGVPADHVDTKALGKQHNLTDAEVKASIAANPTITAEERKRILRNELVIIMASNRRVDVTLSTTGQTSVKQFPFNAADSLTLIGGREKPKPPAKKAAPATKPAPKKAQAKKQ